MKVPQGNWLGKLKDLTASFKESILSSLALPIEEEELAGVPVVFPIFVSSGTHQFIKIADRHHIQTVVFTADKGSLVRNIPIQEANILFDMAIDGYLEFHGFERITEAEYFVHYRAVMDQCGIYLDK